MHPVLRFLNSLDRRATRAIVVTLILFAAVLAVFILGKLGGARVVFDDNDAQLINWMQANAHSWWGLPATIVVFTIAAFIGVPQFVLIAAAVTAFGPAQGALYAWMSTIAAASVMFVVGRFAGADTVRKYGGDTVNRLSQMIGRNGFMASMTVRFVPLAPAIVVNMASGASHMSYLAFAGGLGVGSIPKIAVVAFLGQSLVEVVTGGGWRGAALLVAIAIAWVAVMLVARARLRKSNAQASTKPE